MTPTEIVNQLERLWNSIAQLEQSLPAYPSQFAEQSGGGSGGFMWGVVREATGSSPTVQVQRIFPADPFDGTWTFSSAGAQTIRCHPNTLALHYSQWVYTGNEWHTKINALPVIRDGSALYVLHYHRLRTFWPAEGWRVTDCLPIPEP